MPRFAASPDELLSLPETLKLSGLEFMQAILDGTNPGPWRPKADHSIWEVFFRFDLESFAI